MRNGLGDTLNRLKSLAKVQSIRPGSTPLGSTKLTPLGDFGSNPGALTGWVFVPPHATASSPLVVVLHGCTQTAAGYDHGSGWSELAERHGFILLFPEQTRANNANLCFNWFEPGDTCRDGGEALSIRQMIAAMVDRHSIGSTRIFVTGLSAGGAMTSVMLACYPELFAGGAIIAGLPYGAAASVPQAFERMRGQGLVSDAAAATRVRRASTHLHDWPTISVWHGTADMTVSQVNADAIIGQWRDLHGVADEPDREDRVDGFPHRAWLDDCGRVAIEEYRITGMGHGTPLATAGDDGLGAAIPHMLDVGISSTRHIAAGWGLLDTRARSAELRPASPLPQRGDTRATVPRPTSAHGIQATIEAALRSAGLMR
ncbi:PHB depolymerase family esterase [Sphingomonas sp.]|uniref:extracellular catalytic domain type 1 short-chain-length polyhydroxyalkanoate depolymerase n=1 Tax=Sphingomonas sp. TaxID=28214 RepID=UPI00286ACFF6|nr:PHB depolymerase family esterase [Sphingomonas sp.]